jgi:hypothetical protein
MINGEYFREMSPNIRSYWHAITSIEPVVFHTNPADSNTTMSKLILAVASASLLWVSLSKPNSRKVPLCNPDCARALQSSFIVYSFTLWRSTQALA